MSALLSTPARATKHKQPPHIADLAIALVNEFEALSLDGRNGLEMVAYLLVHHTIRESDRVRLSDNTPNPVSSSKVIEALKIPVKIIRDSTELAQRDKEVILSTDEELQAEIDTLMGRLTHQPQLCALPVLEDESLLQCNIKDGLSVPEYDYASYSDAAGV